MQKLLNLAELETEVKRLARKIGAREDLLPTFAYSKDGAHPHVEVDLRGYHFVVVERGEEIERITTDDLHTFLYHVFRPIVFSLASEFEVNHRIENQDFRRMLFKREIELFTYISPVWGEIELKRVEEILQRAPYDDNQSVRVDLSIELREQGYEPEVAWNMACGKYSLPQPEV